MFDGVVAAGPGEGGDPGDSGDALAAAAVDSLRSTTAVRAATDAVELQGIATLAQVRRTQALGAAREAGRDRDRAAGRTPGSGPVPLVDLDEVDRYTAQEVSLALWLSPVVARDRLELAVELVERRPATFQALREGGIDLVRARRITDAVRHVLHHLLKHRAGFALDMTADGTTTWTTPTGQQHTDHPPSWGRPPPA